MTCEDKKITDVYFNIMRRCYKSLVTLGLYALGFILIFYLTVFKCLPCRIIYYCIKCLCKSCQTSCKKARKKRKRHKEEKERQAERKEDAEKFEQLRKKLDQEAEARNTRVKKKKDGINEDELAGRNLRINRQ